MYVSKWMDISLALGLYKFAWVAWPLGLNNPLPLCFDFCLSPTLLLHATQPEGLFSASF